MNGYGYFFTRTTAGQGGGGGGVDAGSGSITFTDTTPLGPFVIPLSTTVMPTAIVMSQTAVSSIALIRTADLPFLFDVAAGRNTVAFNITAFGAGTVSGTVTANTFVPGQSGVLNVIATA